MSPAGNGSPEAEPGDVRPPFPRRPTPTLPIPEDVQRKRQAEAQRHQDAERQDAFMVQVNTAAHLLSSIGIELGQVGQDDKLALQQFATQMQEHTKRYVTQLVDRKRRELADLERILGKL